jgi:hypothetical protein
LARFFGLIRFILVFLFWFGSVFSVSGL